MPQGTRCSSLLGGIIKCLDSLAKPHHIILYQILGGSFVYNLYTEDYVAYFVLNMLLSQRKKIVWYLPNRPGSLGRPRGCQARRLGPKFVAA